MNCLEPGVLPSSQYYFHTPSTKAKKLYFYPLCLGSFQCVRGYHVKRARHNSFLLILLEEGTLQINYRYENFIANKGSIVLLNCYEPHEYLSSPNASFVFLHFDGNLSLAFFDEIYKKYGCVFTTRNYDRYRNVILSQIELMKMESLKNEGNVSCQIQYLLCDILDVSGEDKSGNETLTKALAYIETYYKNPITIEEIAKAVNLSPYHFSRCFKKEFGHTPYEYILTCRINEAKTLLKTTNRTVAEIAFASGFHSESNFVFSFGKIVGISPGRFRKMPF